jgi:negative regulator of sigma-B (phosphoserine phosphatase)
MGNLKRELVCCGIATAALDGESGDQSLVHPFEGGILLAMIDGLGHGAKAAQAARIASGILQEHADESVLSLARRCHQALKNSRGAVMGLASLNARDASVTWMGIGNVRGLLLRTGNGKHSESSTLLMRAGVLGSTLPALQAAVLAVAPGDTLIFATDGIGDLPENEIRISDPPQIIADQILERHYKGTDDATVLVARFLVEGT